MGHANHRETTTPVEPPNGVRLCCWGTRGSIPSPGPATAFYGGNTACVEVIVDGHRYIFDAGSGACLLGRHIVATEEAPRSRLFLTHFHWDHIQGFPFFAPIYLPDATLEVIGPPQGEMGTRGLLAKQMDPVHFPVPFTAASAALTFTDLEGGDWTDGRLVVSAMQMRHPSLTLGYRIEAPGRVLCFIPDNELVGGEYGVGEDWRRELVEFVGGADLLIHDAMFNDEEYAERAGWGHSTFAQTVDLAREAGVRRLLFFHHSPERSDRRLDDEVARARERASGDVEAPRIDAAREGEEIVL